jgi:glycosyltransferase 2 family protein
LAVVTELAKKPRTTAWRRAAQVLRIALTIAILAGLGWKVRGEWPSVRALTLRGSALDVLGALALSLGGIFGLPLGFVVLLKRAKLYRPSARRFYFRLWLQSYFYRYVPGKVMLMAERVRLGALVGLGGPLSLGLLLWESILLMGGACLVALSMLGMSGGAGPASLAYVEVAAALSVLAMLAFPWAVARGRRSAWARERLGGLVELELGYGDQLLVTVTCALAWITLGTAFYCLCRWFLPLEPRVLPNVVFAFVAGYVVGQVSGVIPGGLGVREAVMAIGLTGVVEPGQAVALAVAERLWMTAIEVVSVALVVRFVPLPSPDGEPSTPARAAVPPPEPAMCVDD